jgi:hypothetical protein
MLSMRIYIVAREEDVVEVEGARFAAITVFMDPARRCRVDVLLLFEVLRLACRRLETAVISPCWWIAVKSSWEGGSRTEEAREEWRRRRHLYVCRCMTL